MWRRWTGLGVAGVVLLSGLATNAVNRASLTRPSTVLDGVVFTGTIAPSHEVDVTSTGGGTIRRVLVSVGTEVTVGQPLAELDDAAARAALDAATLEQQYATEELLRARRSLVVLDRSIQDIAMSFAQSVGTVALAQRQAEHVPGRQLRDSPERAKAVLEQATTKLQRLQRLHAEGIVADETLEDQIIAVRIAQDDYDNARQWQHAASELQRAQQEQAQRQIARSRAEFEQVRGDYVARLSQAEARAEQARQRVAAARRAVDETVVTAAIPGVVLDIAVEVGDRIAAGGKVLAMARLRELVVKVPVSSTLVNLLHPGQPSIVMLPTNPEERVTGRIISINPMPAANMTHTVDVGFENTAGRLLSGQPAQVTFR